MKNSTPVDMYIRAQNAFDHVQHLRVRPDAMGHGHHNLSIDALVGVERVRQIGASPIMLHLLQFRAQGCGLLRRQDRQREQIAILPIGLDLSLAQPTLIEGGRRDEGPSLLLLLLFIFIFISIYVSFILLNEITY